MAQNIGIPKGCRDFSPLEVRKREYILSCIKNIFRLHGFMPIETPSMENLSTLLGKYGEEGDKLLFRILNSGDFWKEAQGLNPSELSTEERAAKLSKLICEKGLRYDLTVPFARYVVMHRNEIDLPFKRFQIQNVWRADRPQKGRYREFCQCDADVVGSKSLYYEAEIAQLVYEVFDFLGINICLKINNRKILSALAIYLDCSDKLIELTTAIDKLDKIGAEGIVKELVDKGLDQEKIKKLFSILSLNGSSLEILEKLKQEFADIEVGLKGIEEIEEVFRKIELLCPRLNYSLDLSLARGLNYYTGCIFEVKATDYSIGSISGGGRYDELTGIFGLKDVSGVGISFGIDRIYDVLEGLNAFPSKFQEALDVLFVNFTNEDCKIEEAVYGLINSFRANGISCDFYASASKIQKQFTYANKLNIPFVAIVGEDEIANQSITIKDLRSGTQSTVRKEEAIKFIKDNK